MLHHVAVNDSTASRGPRVIMVINVLVCSPYVGFVGYAIVCRLAVVGVASCDSIYTAAWASIRVPYSRSSRSQGISSRTLRNRAAAACPLFNKPRVGSRLRYALRLTSVWFCQHPWPVQYDCGILRSPGDTKQARWDGVKGW